jgi:uncharacterized membrane protein
MSASDATRGPTVRDDHRAEARLNAVISRVLVVGLLIAVGLLVIGVILAAARPGATVVDSTSISDIPAQLAAGEPSGFLQLGLLVLLATPFARVVALGIAYTQMRQWLFAGISALVAVLLVVGAVLGLSLG